LNGFSQQGRARQARRDPMRQAGSQLSWYYPDRADLRPLAPQSPPRHRHAGSPFAGEHSAILRSDDSGADRARRFGRDSRRRKRYRLIVNVVHLNWRPVSVASQPLRRNM
jgi:hypothetical protein